MEFLGVIVVVLVVGLCLLLSVDGKANEPMGEQLGEERRGRRTGK